MEIKKQDVFKTILDIAHDIAGKDIPKNVNLGSSVSEFYYDMYMDSLDEIEIVMKIEKHYGINIPDDKVVAYRHKTFDDVCGFICTLINQQKQPVSLSHKIKQLFQRTK